MTVLVFSTYKYIMVCFWFLLLHFKSLKYLFMLKFIPVICRTFDCSPSNTSYIKIKMNTPSGLIYKKHMTFLIHWINDVFGLYSRQDTSITQ